MGLDTVELVMEIEEEFRIGISDKDAQELQSVGALIRYLQARLRTENPEACRTSRMFYHIRCELMKHFTVPRRDIRPSVKLESLVRGKHRRMVWKKLRGANVRMPQLQRPRWLSWGVAGLVVAPSAFLVVTFHNWNLGIAALLLMGMAAFVATQPFAVRVESPIVTVRDLALYNTPVKELWHAQAGVMSDSQIARRVREIVSEQTGVRLDKINEDTRFIEDLGMG